MENFENYEPRNYLRRAFRDQHNVILMLGALLLGLAFASFLPLLIGLCAEALFLVVCPRLQAFRDWADGQDSSARKQRVQRVLRAELATLASSYGARFNALSGLLDEVVAGIAAHRVLSFAELEGVRDHFERLLEAALVLMRRHQGVLAAIAEIPTAALIQEVAALERAFASQRDLELRMGLRQQVLAVRKKLAQAGELESTGAKLELELQAIEKGVTNLGSRSSDLRSSGQMLNEVRALLSDVAPDRATGPAPFPATRSA